jgi:hypothetical protein
MEEIRGERVKNDRPKKTLAEQVNANSAPKPVKTYGTPFSFITKKADEFGQLAVFAVPSDGELTDVSFSFFGEGTLDLNIKQEGEKSIIFPLKFKGKQFRFKESMHVSQHDVVTVMLNSIEPEKGKIGHMDQFILSFNFIAKRG